MTSQVRLALGSAACLLLCACDPTGPVDPAANLTDNVVIAGDEPTIPPLEPRGTSDRDRVSDSANQEPDMPDPDPDPDPATTPPPATPPAPPPRRVILPAPTQPPAEVDPVHVDPGDEVPR